MNSAPRPNADDYVIEPTTEDRVPAIRALNQRFKDAKSRHGFYDMVRPDWLAHEPGASVWREFFVLIERATGLVRGGYGMKYEQFLLNGKQVELGWLQGPVAESAIRPDMKGLGGIMVRAARKQNPLQISWGANSIAAPSAGSVPMLLRVHHAAPFLREIRMLKGRAKQAANLAAATGLGGVGIALAQRRNRGLVSAPRYTAVVRDSFAGWSQPVWDAAKDKYALIAFRDAVTLDRLLPTKGYPQAIPLEVRVDDRTVGWAALRVQELQDDSQFGTVRSGSVIDALAAPGYEGVVALAATRELERRKVDLLGGCFLHKDWIEAFRRAGWLVLPNRRNIGFSLELQEAGGGLEHLLNGTHLALIDSDGPRIF